MLSPSTSKACSLFAGFGGAWRNGAYWRHRSWPDGWPCRGLAIGTLAGPFASRTGGAHELEHAFDASGSLSVTRSELRSVRCLAWMPRRRATPHRAMAASSVGQAISRKLALPGSDRKPRAMKAPRHAALIWAMDPLTLQTAVHGPAACGGRPVRSAKPRPLRCG